MLQPSARLSPRWGGNPQPFPKTGEIGTVVYLGAEQHLKQPLLLFIPPAPNAVPILKMGASPPLMTSDLHSKADILPSAGN